MIMFPLPAKDPAKITEDRETLLIGKDVSANLRVQETMIADLPSSLELKTGQTPAPMILSETEAELSRRTRSVKSVFTQLVAYTNFYSVVLTKHHEP